jgi:hypothetical protein
LKIGIGREGIETREKKLILELCHQVEHPKLVERVGIRPYMRNDMLHMMLEMEYIMPMIPNLEMYYLVHCFQICLWVGVAPPMLGAHITKD